MANVDDVKDAIEEALPGGRSRRARRLPAALLLALVAGVAAWASRLAPVREAVGTAVSTARTRLASMTGRGTPETGDAGADAAADAAGVNSTADAFVTDMPGGSASTEAAEAPFEAPTTDLAAADATSVAPAEGGPTEESGAASPSEPETIPADSEEGRPAGV